MRFLDYTIFSPKKLTLLLGNTYCIYYYRIRTIFNINVIFCKKSIYYRMNSAETELSVRIRTTYIM